MNQIIYEGWANRETQEVATLIESDEGLLGLASNYAYRVSPFEAFRYDLRKLGVISTKGTDSDSEAFFSSRLVIEELNDMIRSMAEVGEAR